MDNDFSKWMSIVRGDNVEDLSCKDDKCDCQHWSCQSCFPNKENEINSAGIDSPLTHTTDILDEESVFYLDKTDVIDDILSLQQLGLSKSDETYTNENLNLLSDEDLLQVYDNVTGESTSLSEDQFNKAITISLLEQVQWDSQIKEILDESSLSRLIGKQKGGQNLVKWLHRRHKLSNEAELTPAPFSQRLLWKEFKKNPDNFIIISAENGVAGVKPYKKFIDDRTAEFAKRGRTYNPGGDNTLPYQVIAFTDDGAQIDPDLLRAPAEDGEQIRDPRDPTVMNARMGKHSGKDNLNPYNVFNLLADQIGALRTVYISGFENEKEGQSKGSVERDKLQKRIEYKTDKTFSNEDAESIIIKKLEPILNTIVSQSLSYINKKAKEYIDNNDFDNAQKMSLKGQKIKSLLSISGINAVPAELKSIIKSVISSVSGINTMSPEYNDYLNSIIKGGIPALKPIVDALRKEFIKI